MPFLGLQFRLIINESCRSAALHIGAYLQQRDRCQFVHANHERIHGDGEEGVCVVDEIHYYGQILL